MRTFSGTGAIGAGFRLIGREPVAFLAWAVVYGVVGLLPQLFVMGKSLGAMMNLGANPDPTAAAAAMAPLQQLQPISILTALVNFIVVGGAVFRAVLRPEDNRFFFLRLGARELWLGLTTITLFVIYIVAIVVMIIPFFIVIGVSAASGDGGGAAAAMLITVPLFFAGFWVIVWGALRLSLSMPMSFAEKNFRIPESWKKTKGHAGKMFGVMVVIMLMLIGIELLLGGIAFGALTLIAPLPELGRMFTANPASLISKINPAVWVVVVAIWALFGTWYTVMVGAAFAGIYRDLSDEPMLDVFS
jgi:hypothetical protein